MDFSSFLSLSLSKDYFISGPFAMILRRIACLIDKNNKILSEEKNNDKYVFRKNYKVKLFIS
jgi:hypothetical protein